MGLKNNKCWFVTDVLNAPGRVYAVFVFQEDAEMFADAITDKKVEVEVEERTMWYGQPTNRGYNR